MGGTLAGKGLVSVAAHLAGRPAHTPQDDRGSFCGSQSVPRPIIRLTSIHPAEPSTDRFARLATPDRN
jgi:hypothetical protein